MQIKLLIKRLLIIIVLFFSISGAHLLAQEIKITGSVKDTIGNAVSFASVVVSNTPSEKSILGFAKTNDSGEFSIRLNNADAYKRLWVSIRHLSFLVKKVEIEAVTQDIQVQLEAFENQLEEVVVNAKRTVELKGDTIVYNVEGIKKAKDYTIEDVIKRIPGIRIDDGGKIFYNGRLIAHFYINGVDLLEGRYNIATQGIAADAVENVEVLRKHSHARIDIGRTATDDVALNLNIKENQKLTFGTGRVEAGFPLLTGKVEVTPFVIKDKVQNVTAFKTNNIGISLTSTGRNLTQHNSDFADIALQNANIIQPPTTSANTFSAKDWLDNNSLALTNNFLIKTKPKSHFKVVSAYSQNESRLRTIQNSLFFGDNDTIGVNRSTFNKLDTRNYSALIVNETNKESLFFRNALEYNGSTSSGLSDNVQNSLSNLGVYRFRTHKISNTTNFKTLINNQIINNGILVEYNQDDDSFTNFPAVFQGLIPGSVNAQNSLQNIETNRFNLGGFSTLDFDVLGLDLNFKQSLLWQNERLKSNLINGEEDTTNPVMFPFKSDFTLGTFETVSRLKSEKEWKKWKFTAALGLKNIFLDRSEKLADGLNENKSFHFLQLKAGLNYSVNRYWNLSFGGDIDSYTSRFQELNNGVLLVNFSNLRRNPNFINVTQNQSAYAYLGYENILKGFFFSQSFNINKSTSEATFSTSLDQDGFVNVEVLPLENTANMWTSSTKFTKKFFGFLSADATLNFSRFKTNQFFNNMPQENKIFNKFFSFELNLDKNTWYGITYNFNINESISKLANIEATNLFLSNKLTLDFYFTSKTRFDVVVNSVFSEFSDNASSNTNTLFDSSFYFKPNKKQLWFVRLQNLFNEKSLTSVFSNANSLSQTQTFLRQRQLTFGLNYSF